jgi:cation transport regulator ChaC
MRWESNKVIYYFAYGSNMDEKDLDRWCKKKELPAVRFLGKSPAKLDGYTLSFNYYSTSRNGGVANIMESKNDCVYGLLIEMEKDNLNTIRLKEGYPNSYDEICVDVETFEGTLFRDVKTYKVVKYQEKPNHQPPTRYYMQLIIKNAKKYNFPSEYIRFLESIKIIEEPTNQVGD